VESILENGGDVRFNNGAARIVVEGGRVTGVVAEDGTPVSTSYVVSNANPITTCLDLVGRENVPSWYLKRLGWGKIGISLFTVFLGLDCPVERLGLANHEIMYNLDYDFESHYDEARKAAVFQPRSCAIAPYNVLDPEFSPPGTCVVTLTTVGFGNLWRALPPDRYVEAKNRLASRLIDLAERTAPGLRDHIEVLEVATPLTHMRYTGNWEGAVYGYQNSPTEGTVLRLPNRGPLEGLYFTGAWVRLGGGFQPCIDSGRTAAENVLEDMEKGGMGAAGIESVKAFCESQAAEAPEIDLPARAVDRALSSLHPDRVRLRVAEIIQETESTKTLRMVAAEGSLPTFRAGQYVNLFCEVDGVLTSRPYSISSPPGKDYWDLTVRRVEGGFVSPFLLDRVRVGDTFLASGPAGSFYPQPLMDTEDLVFLAGGSGVTPFASIVRERAERGGPFRIHLLYGTRDPEDVIFWEELRELSRKEEWFRLDLVVSEPPEGYAGLCGLLDRKTISSLVEEPEKKTFFLCGPAPMYPLCTEALLSLGVPARRIKREAYGPPRDITTEPGWPGADPEATFSVTEERSGRTFPARCGEPLLSSLERAGLRPVPMCRPGRATGSRTRVL
jgi:ferredoxin-NADP reductase